MTTSMLRDAFAHNIWATERLLDACGALTPEQLRTPAPGTYGSIIDTFRHIVGSDGWYLSFFRDVPVPLDPEGAGGLAELRASTMGNGPAWLELVEGALDADADVPEQGDGWVFHAPVGIRLSQAIHHGTDHRSQICTALTSLGIEPPEIDVWAYGQAAGRTREA
jgi:uncharacterized damage-inducible protein DinB